MLHANEAPSYKYVHKSNRARRPSRVRQDLPKLLHGQEIWSGCSASASLSARGSAEPRPLISRRAQAGDSMQEAPQPKPFDKLLCLCLAAPDTAIKLGKPVLEHLWGAVLQELHVWGAQ